MTHPNATTMPATLYGCIAKPAIAFVGSWDPILPAHMALVNRLIQHANQKNLASLIVVLDPAPASFVFKTTYPDAEWINYNEIETNINHLLNAGLNGVLRIRFKPEYLTMGVAELYDTIIAHVELAEFWFGAKQTFGRTPEGSQDAIIKLARERGIKLRRLGQTDMDKLSGKIRHFLTSGQPGQAAQYAQYPLIRKRPLSGEIVLPWLAGTYYALPITNLVKDKDILTHTDRVIKFTLQSKGKLSSKLRWPDPDMEYLLFVAGPNDPCIPDSI